MVVKNAPDCLGKVAGRGVLINMSSFSRLSPRIRLPDYSVARIEGLPTRYLVTAPFLVSEFRFSTQRTGWALLCRWRRGLDSEAVRFCSSKLARSDG
jgi:hypothetical protein